MTQSDFLQLEKEAKQTKDKIDQLLHLAVTVAEKYDQKRQDWAHKHCTKKVNDRISNYQNHFGTITDVRIDRVTHLGVAFDLSVRFDYDPFEIGNVGYFVAFEKEKR